MSEQGKGRYLELCEEGGHRSIFCLFFFSSRRRHTRWNCDWSSDVCSSDLLLLVEVNLDAPVLHSSEQASRVVRRALYAQVLESRRGGHAPAGSALDEPALEQVGLVDVLDRVGLLGHRDRERGQAHRATLELLADRAQDVAVETVEPRGVDLQQPQRLVGDLLVDAARGADLRVVAHALQQAVGHARRAARARGDQHGAGVVDVDVEDARRPVHDAGQVLRLVEVEPVRDAEAVAQRRGQEARPRGGPDQRERRQVERDHARSCPLPHRDRQAAVLHGRIEGLLERARQAVDLVDEEHRARLERREERRDVALAFERRAGGLHEGHVQLGRHDLRERGLAEPGRSRQQHVVERLAALLRRLDEHRQLVLHRALADEVLEPARPQRAVELLVGPGGRRGLDALDARRPDAALVPHRAALRASPIRSSGVSPSASASSSSASWALKPRPTRPCRASVRGSSVLVITISSIADSPATFSRSSTMIRSAVRLPMPGTAWKRALSPEAIARSSSFVVPPDSTASATFGPTPCTPISSRNSSRSSSLEKPYRYIPSSRMTRWVCRSFSLPTAGTALSVSADTASR